MSPFSAFSPLAHQSTHLHRINTQRFRLRAEPAWTTGLPGLQLPRGHREGPWAPQAAGSGPGSLRRPLGAGPGLLHRECTLQPATSDGKRLLGGRARPLSPLGRSIPASPLRAGPGAPRNPGLSCAVARPSSRAALGPGFCSPTRGGCPQGRGGGVWAEHGRVRPP